MDTSPHSPARLSRKVLGDYQLLELTSAKGASLQVLPELGGTIQRLCLPDPSGQPRELLRSDNLEELAANPGFRNRILFPFCGRVRSGRYRWEGLDYRLNLPGTGEHGLHGYLHASRLDQRPAQDASATLRLEWPAQAASWQGYPFRIALSLEYSLSDKGFQLRLAARNLGSEAAPLSLGWHPYLRLDAEPADWRLSNAAKRYIPMGADLFPAGPAAPVGGSAYDFRGGRGLAGRWLDGPLLCPPDGLSILSAPACPYRIALWQDPSCFDYTQLYTPPSRDSLAIEPVSAVSGAFNAEGPGLVRLEAGQELAGSIRLSLIEG